MNPPSEDPKDWETQDEVPPEKLQKKWDEEEYADGPTVDCPSCKKRVPASSFKCLYCGAQVFHDSGLLGKIMKWIRFWR
jgi:hypothetical protein